MKYVLEDVNCRQRDVAVAIEEIQDGSILLLEPRKAVGKMRICVSNRDGPVLGWC
jgi:hypothetical protein